MKKDWTVKIKKKYRRSLSKRFNPRNAKKTEGLNRVAIKEPCSLCKDFLTGYGCNKKCPFKRFARTRFFEGSRLRKKAGCFVWLNHIVSNFTHHVDVLPSGIYWSRSTSPRIVKMFKQLRKEAKKLITWV